MSEGNKWALSLDQPITVCTKCGRIGSGLFACFKGDKGALLCEDCFRELTPISPPHYKGTSIEPIQVIEDWKLGFHLGNVLKYLRRWEEKNGVEDLQKALWYLNRFISLEERKKNENNG